MEHGCESIIRELEALRDTDMVKVIYAWLIGRIFSKEIEALHVMRTEAKTKQVELDARLQAVQLMKENANITALVREQLKGFNPRLLDSDKEIVDEFGDDTDGLNTFLTAVHELSKNIALPVITNYLKRNQVWFSAAEATSLEAVNFSRATINGIQLFEEEVSALEGVYKKAHEPEEEYDEDAVV